MSRTTMKLPLKGQSIDDILQMLDSLMTKNGYSKKIIKDEEVWAKGDGIVMQLQCFSVAFTAEELVLQGWMKDAITGESDLSSFGGKLPKRKMKAIMDDIAARILA